VLGRSFEEGDLARTFGMTIHADRFGRVGFGIRGLLGAGEHVIGADVKDAGFFLCGKDAEMAHGFGIDGKRLGFVRLAIIDIGECGAIYQDIEIEGFEGLRKQIGLGRFS